RGAEAGAQTDVAAAPPAETDAMHALDPEARYGLVGAVGRVIVDHDDLAPADITDPVDDAEELAHRRLHVLRLVERGDDDGQLHSELRTSRAGTPATVDPASVERRTTEPRPTKVPRPSLTFWKMRAPLPR